MRFMEIEKGSKAWVVGADMGYGHLRAVYALKHLAEEGIITAGVDDGASVSEKKLWSRVMRTYAAFSRASSVPLIGRPLFNLLDRIQRIPPIVPGRDLARPTFQLGLLEGLLSHGLCAGMLEKIRTNHLPLVTSFYATAIAAERANYHHTYCIICDAEIHRVWVARSPGESHIVYFAPCEQAVERLRAYGVPQERIYLTGFPLPDELIGGRELSTLKRNFGRRLRRLDPEGKFLDRSKSLQIPRGEKFEQGADHPLTITYAVGGAGAQKEIGEEIARSLAPHLAARSIKLNLVAGLNAKVHNFFSTVKTSMAPGSNSIEIIYGRDFEKYFDRFNAILHETDILWTKPSELSFYAALGLPIIMSPPLGSQEEYNRRWLLDVGAGINQKDPAQTAFWLIDMLETGALAQAAFAGYSNVRKRGTYAIGEILETGELSEAESLIPPSERILFP